MVLHRKINQARYKKLTHKQKERANTLAMLQFNETSIIAQKAVSPIKILEIAKL